MISLLSKIFIKNSTDFTDSAVRRAYGTLCSIFGIFLNILLFGFKFFAGTLTGSIAITADSFNNLGDAGSSVITLIGFRLSSQKPDPDHPFGHGRFEYISGLFVSVAILLMGFELAKSSLSKIITPEPVDKSYIAIVILFVSVIAKLYMCFYNRSIGKKIASSAMKATGSDSLSDALSTFVVLCVTAVSGFLPFNIDGYAGMLVALFILWTGINSIKETISPLLGQPPEEEFVRNVEKTVLSYDVVSSIHDLVVHDYGPGRLMISLHAEIPSSMDLMLAHDVIDNIENRISNELGCHCIIHMDPINTDDEFTNSLRMKVASLAASIDERITIHDFRCVVGPSHTNLIFDAVVPFECKIEDSEFKERLSDLVKMEDPKLNCVILIDKSYVK